jgi:hypothetical protein
VDETHFYHHAGGDIFARRIDEPEGKWVRVGAMSPRITGKSFLTASDGKLFLRSEGGPTDGPTVLTKAALDPNDSWTELPNGRSSYWGFASAEGRLFSGGEKSVYELPFNRPDASWQQSRQALPMPNMLAVWGDRVLHIPAEPGSIRSRLVSDPDAPWEEMGHVHVPREQTAATPITASVQTQTSGR